MTEPATRIRKFFIQPSTKNQDPCTYPQSQSEDEDSDEHQVESNDENKDGILRVCGKSWNVPCWCFECQMANFMDDPTQKDEIKITHMMRLINTLDLKVKRGLFEQLQIQVDPVTTT